MDKSIKMLIVLVIVIVVAAGGSFAYILFSNDNSSATIEYVNSKDGADVTQNSVLNAKIISSNGMNDSKLTYQVIQAAKNGTPVVQFGNGEGPVSVIIAGVHGNQLSPQIAALGLIDYLDGKQIKGTVYVIPFAAPEATAVGQKYLNGMNLNTVADQTGTPSNDIVRFSISKNATAVGDFHATAPGAVPGHDVIMCSQAPTYNSYKLATAMCKILGEDIEVHSVAGVDYKGAIEDVLNLKGTPSITGLSTSAHGTIASGSVETSFDQMIALLKVNGNLD